MASDPSLLGGPGQLPDDLREEAARALQKVGAYLGSEGDPRVMESFKDPPGVMALVFLTAGLGIVLWILAEIGNYYEIRNNWVHYQCMPSVAPFAKFYGHDLQETMNFCISQQVKEHAGGVITPIYKGVLEVQQVVDSVFTKVETVESGISGLLKQFETFVINFVNSFRLLGVQVRVALVRIREIFQRVFGIFIAFAFAAISAITFGENLICNPLVTFVGAIAGVDVCCFAPEVRVGLASGGARRIDAICIGDRLLDGGYVTGTFVFDGAAVPMVSIGGVHVSTNHSLHGLDGEWVAAGAHPLAMPVPSRERIICLTTSTHRIPVLPWAPGADPLIFTDYEETDDPAVAAAAQAAAERALNRGETAGPVVSDFSLGLDPQAKVLVDGGEWMAIENLTVGTLLANGSRISGIVREWCADVRVTPGGLRMSAAQLVRGLAGRGWFRAGTRFTATAEPAVLCHVFLNTNDSLTIATERELWSVRDYQEWHGPETQSPYDAWLAAGAPAQAPQKGDASRRADTPRPYDDDEHPFRVASLSLGVSASDWLEDDDAGLAIDLGGDAGGPPRGGLVDGSPSSGEYGFRVSGSASLARSGSGNSCSSAAM